LKTPAIIYAFGAIERADFMTPKTILLAGVDRAIYIGHGQSISQPAVVAIMLELLQPQPGDKVLDIGSGSGWTTALLTETVGSNGKVIAVELIPALSDFGANNAAKYNPEGVAEFICGDASKGWPEEAPYNRILVSAEAENLPPELVDQLKVGGRIVIPIGHSIWLFVKKSETELEPQEYKGFNFVPLLDKDDILRKEKTRKFLSEHPLHRNIIVAIVFLVAKNMPPSVAGINDLINIGLALKGGRPLYSIEQVTEAVSQLAEMGLIKPAWALAVNLEEIDDLIGDVSEEPVAEGV
jgi:protein-L-isoaspartate(D-aspartate) O-methyltransferase